MHLSFYNIIIQDILILIIKTIVRLIYFVQIPNFYSLIKRSKYKIKYKRFKSAILYYISLNHFFYLVLLPFL